MWKLFVFLFVACAAEPQPPSICENAFRESEGMVACAEMIWLAPYPATCGDFQQNVQDIASCYGDLDMPEECADFLESTISSDCSAPLLQCCKDGCPDLTEDENAGSCVSSCMFFGGGQRCGGGGEEDCGRSCDGFPTDCDEFLDMAHGCAESCPADTKADIADHLGCDWPPVIGNDPCSQDFVCEMFCEHGFRRDQNGCAICECVNCDACVAEFAANGGCDDFGNEDLIPEGCYECGDAAAEFCGVDGEEEEEEEDGCHWCVAEFAASGGCDDFENGDLIPEGCYHCGEAAAEFCGVGGGDEEEEEEEEDCGGSCDGFPTNCDEFLNMAHGCAQSCPVDMKAEIAQELECEWYNCATKEVWSKEKSEWCCENQGLGCTDINPCRGFKKKEKKKCKKCQKVAQRCEGVSTKKEKKKCKKKLQKCNEFIM